jgi:hypothetical protein
VINVYALPAEVIDRIVQERCSFCNKIVSAVDVIFVNFGIASIDGDSENGYELYHERCARRNHEGF